MPVAMPARGEAVDGFSATVGPKGTVSLRGELDITGVEALRAALDQAMNEAGNVVIVDVAELSFIDSLAISELLRVQITAATQQRFLRLENIPDVIGSVLDILDLRETLTSPDGVPSR